jgi:hypothetical protein
MGVNVGATRDALNHFADRSAILKNGFIFGQIAQSDLMAERDIIEEFHFSGLFTFKRHCANSGAFFQIHDGDSDIVLGFVQQNSMLHNSNESKLSTIRVDWLIVSAAGCNLF